MRAILETLIALSLLAEPALPSPKHPGFVDAPTLAALCTADPVIEPEAPAICLGYVVGAVDQLFMDVDGGPRRPCLPDHITAEEIVALVRANASIAAGSEGSGAADFLRDMLQEAFPCPVT